MNLMIPEADLAAWLRQHNIDVDETSPLNRVLQMPVEVSHSPMPVPTDMEKAISWVAMPDIECGVHFINAKGGISFWFYRQFEDTDKIVGHFRDHEGQHLFIWTDEKEFIGQLKERLFLDTPLQGGDIGFDCSVKEFQVFLSAIDWWREQTLISLLERDQKAAFRTTPEKVLKTFTRSLDSKDRRWLTPSIAKISPFDFGLSAKDCKLGLAKLAEVNLAVNDGETWSFTPVMNELCAGISVSTAIGAVFSRTRNEDKNWDRRHLVAMRGMARFCIAKFEDLDTPEPIVRFRDSSWPDLELAILDRFMEWRKRGSLSQAPDLDQPAEQAPASPIPTSSTAFCSQCGQNAKPEDNFCSTCGNRLK